MFSTNLLNQILNTFEAVNSALERRAGHKYENNKSNR